MSKYKLILLSTLFGIIFSCNGMVSVYADEGIVVTPMLDYAVIAGEWQRTDGGYVIKVSDVQPDGHAMVEYFNPNPIYVAQAAISTRKQLIKLYIRFQDKGYEGSNYTLYYYAEKDALVGFYYQAPMDRTFDVIFLRKKSL